MISPSTTSIGIIIKRCSAAPTSASPPSLAAKAATVEVAVETGEAVEIVEAVATVVVLAAAAAGVLALVHNHR